MKLTILSNPEGITVAELKQHIADWPEIDNQGLPTEVWICDNGLSGPCRSVTPLTLRELANGSETGDLLLEH